MSTNDIKKLRGELDEIKILLTILTGIQPGQYWVSPPVAAKVHGFSANTIKRQIEKAEAARAIGQHPMLRYGVHYRKKPETEDWQINLPKYGDWVNLPPEKRSI